MSFFSILSNRISSLVGAHIDFFFQQIENRRLSVDELRQLWTEFAFLSPPASPSFSSKSTTATGAFTETQVEEKGEKQHEQETEGKEEEATVEKASTEEKKAIELNVIVNSEKEEEGKCHKDEPKKPIEGNESLESSNFTPMSGEFSASHTEANSFERTSEQDRLILSTNQKSTCPISGSIPTVSIPDESEAKRKNPDSSDSLFFLDQCSPQDVALLFSPQTMDSLTRALRESFIEPVDKVIVESEVSGSIRDFQRSSHTVEERNDRFQTIDESALMENSQESLETANPDINGSGRKRKTGNKNDHGGQLKTRKLSNNSLHVPDKKTTCEYIIRKGNAKGSNCRHAATCTSSFGNFCKKHVVSASKNSGKKKEQKISII